MPEPWEVQKNMGACLEQIGSELSIIRTNALSCDWNKGLHYCWMEYRSSGSTFRPSPEDNLLHDVLLKGLQRGQRPFTSYFLERWIVALYGEPFAIREEPGTGKGSITYSYDDALPHAYQEFADLVEPWKGGSESVAFDPEHPENERQLFQNLIKRFGARLGHCVSPQVNIATILNPKTAGSFAGQRADLLLHFPNGKGLLLEPGDHDDVAQSNLDKRRDKAFGEVGIQTLRPRNSEIPDKSLYSEVKKNLSRINALRFLHGVNERSEIQLACNYLFLLPSLIARIERLLLHFFFRQGLMRRESLRIGIIERDLECSELAVANVLDKVERLSKLYGLKYNIPSIQLIVQRNPDYRFGDLSGLDISAQECDRIDASEVDLLLDVAIKCNTLTPPDLEGAIHQGQRA